MLWYFSQPFRALRCEGQQSCSRQGKKEKKMTIKTNVKTGALNANHNQSGLAVKTTVKAGALSDNHNQSGIAVKTAVKAGSLTSNHNQTTRQA